MTIFVANTTKQHFNFHYRIPEHKATWFQVSSGSQVEVGHGWNSMQVDSFISQLDRYGGRPANEVHKKIGNFAGIFYRLDRSISENEILGGHEQVVEAQEKRSAQEATKAAAGYDMSLRGKDGRTRLAKVTEVEVKEDLPRNQKPTGDEVSFKLSVEENGSDLSSLTKN